MRITKKWIMELSEEFDKSNPRGKDKEENLFLALHETGCPPTFITKEILIKIVDWKSPRVKGRIRNNTNDYVRRATEASLASANEKMRLEILTLLEGVNIRMASAILMFCFPGKYTVMDWRAWESLKKLRLVNGELKETYECYKEYNDVCSKISKRFKVSLRLLDKALWYWKGGK